MTAAETRAPPGFGEHLRRLRQGAGLTQAQLAERSGITTDAIAALERGLRQHPYPHTVLALSVALDLPGEEHSRLVSLAARRHSASATPGIGQPLSKLPAPLTELIGRSREAASLRKLLGDRSHARLVTVVGGGGVGKTALALRVAGELWPSFRDGVFLVELASIDDPTLVPTAVGLIVGMADAPGTLVPDAIASFLASKSLLLAIDNCEHLIDACAPLVEYILIHCPFVRVLATSREPLLISGEQQVRLAPLSTPEPDALMALAELSSYPAVQLFVERAKAVYPDFAVTAQNSWAIAQICSRLAGIPLAIELAAARLRLLTPAQIVARLDETFSLLTSGSRTAPTRHQTLRATLDWSYDLLAEPERAAFRRLSVFAGGFDLAAAESVGSQPPICQIARAAAPTTAPALTWLTDLLNKSLVVSDDGDRALRYRLLEPVRQYAAGQLTARREEADIRARHAAYYLGLADQATRELADQTRSSGWSGWMANATTCAQR